jgi:hypothetical protein
MTGMMLIALPAFFGNQSHTAVGGVETVTTRTEGTGTWETPFILFW